MEQVASLRNTRPPHLVRLQNLALLAPAEIDALVASARRSVSFAPRREVLSVGSMLAEPMLLIRGWAAQVRYFQDGRRQFLHLLLPGDMISMVQKPGTVAVTTTVALTEISVAKAPLAENDSGLGEAYALSVDLERISLLRQIVRIGRLDAYERLADLFLELLDRLHNVGLAPSNSFEMPLTQEMIADCLGLTAVHVNRTLRQMRQEGMIDDRGRAVRLIDADRLRSLVDYQPLTIRPQPLI